MLCSANNNHYSIIVDSNMESNLSEEQPGTSRVDLTTSDKRENEVKPSLSNNDNKEILRDQMKDLFATIIKDIDKQVLTVSESQFELDSQLDKLISILDSIKIDEKLTGEISANAKKISSLKSRLTLIHTILSNSSTRCSRTLAACGAAVSSLNTPSSIPSSSTSSPKR